MGIGVTICPNCGSKEDNVFMSTCTVCGEDYCPMCESMENPDICECCECDLEDGEE